MNDNVSMPSSNRNVIYLESGFISKVQVKNAGVEEFIGQAGIVVGKAYNLDNQVSRLSEWQLHCNV